MKKLLAIFTLSATCAVGQNIEFYASPQTNKYVWTPNYSLANSKANQGGLGIGIRVSPQNQLFGLPEGIQPKLGLELQRFRAFGYRIQDEGASTGSWLTAYRVKISAPVEIKIHSLSQNTLDLYGIVGPNYSLVMHQNYDSWEDNPKLLKTGDFSLDIGAGLRLNLQRERKPINQLYMEGQRKSPLVISSVNMAFVSTVDFDPSATSALGTGSLQQHGIQLGVTMVPRKKPVLAPVPEF